MAANHGAGQSGSKKLKATLGELESALAAWDGLAEIAPTQGPLEVKPTIPSDIRKRTHELLNQLKEQIEELSKTP